MQQLPNSRRRLALAASLVTVAAALALAMAPVASGNGPSRFDAPFPSDGLRPIACGFPVFIEAVQDNAFMLDFGDHFIVNGVSKLRLTNPATSRSIEINATGPVFGSVTEDGLGFVTRHAGHTLFTIGPRTSAATGIPRGIYLSSGLVIVLGTFETGITSITPEGGTWTNLCPQLA